LRHYSDEHVLEVDDGHESGGYKECMHDVHAVVSVVTSGVHFSETDEFTTIIKKANLHHKNIPK